jgi:tripartite-type tricarboxylate transporter receptor subunit TctC
MDAAFGDIRRPLISAALRDASRSKCVADALATNACDTLNMDTAQLNAQINTDLATWGGLLKDMEKTVR